MASGKIKGITIEIGGDTTKLGKAIGDSEKQANSLRRELKEVERALKLDPSNVELLAQKQDILTQAISETTTKLETLKDAQAQVTRQFENGEIGADQFRAFQREILATENSLQELKSELNGADDKIDDVGDSAEQSGEGFTIMKGALADLVSNAIQGALSAIGDLVGALFELSEATEEYRLMQAKLSGSATTFGYDIEFATGKYKDFYKYLGDDQMSTNAITNLMGIGTSTENVSQLADGAIAVWSAYGDSIPIESLTEAINETITVGKVTGGMADTINWAENACGGLENALSGNKEAQDAFKSAIEEGLPVEDAFNEALAKITSQSERADVVAKFLNGTYGDSKAVFDEASKSILDANEAELNLKETQAQLGETMQPVNTALTNLKNQALQAIVPLVEQLADAFLNLLNWLREHPVAMQIVTAVVIALATAFGVLAGALAIQGLISGVTKAIAFLNTTLLANPIVLIVALLAGLVAGFVYLWNTCDGFREFWKGLWENILSIVETVVEWFKGLPSKIGNAISGAIGIVTKWGSNLKNKAVSAVTNLVNTVVTWFKGLPNKISNAISSAISKVSSWGNNLKNKAVTAVSSMVSNVTSKAREIPSKIASAISGALSKVSSWGSQMISTAKSKMASVVSGIKGAFTGLPSSMLSIGKSIIQGVINGIGSMVGALYGSIKSALSGLVSKAKSALGINSPSKVFRDQVGKGISEGIGVGITEGMDEPLDAIDDVNNRMLNHTSGINGATINRQLNTTFSGTVANQGSISDLVSMVSEYFPKLIEASQKAIVLDDGTLVGKTVEKIDNALAGRLALKARGI